MNFATVEGELTELRKLFVSDSALAPVSEALGLPGFFIKSKGDTVLKKSVPSAYEAVLAAIYLDGGMDAARSFVDRTLGMTPPADQKNYKGELQELVQSGGEPLPVYVREDIGTPQKPMFRSSVTICGQVFTGEAQSVKQADMLAAEAALKFLKK